MSTDMDARIRAALGRGPAEPGPVDGEPAPVDHDGGARTSAPAAAPSMTRILRAIVGVGPPDAGAERWLREH